MHPHLNTRPEGQIKLQLVDLLKVSIYVHCKCSNACLLKPRGKFCIQLCGNRIVDGVDESDSFRIASSFNSMPEKRQSNWYNFSSSQTLNRVVIYTRGDVDVTTRSHSRMWEVEPEPPRRDKDSSSAGDNIVLPLLLCCIYTGVSFPERRIPSFLR